MTPRERAQNRADALAGAAIAQECARFLSLGLDAAASREMFWSGAISFLTGFCCADVGPVATERVLATILDAHRQRMRAQHVQAPGSKAIN